MAKPAAQTLEQFLATLYVDPVVRARFLASPEVESSRAGLSEEQCLKLKDIDLIGLEMASRSFARKRAVKRATSDSIPSLGLGNSWLARVVKNLLHQRLLIRGQTTLSSPLQPKNLDKDHKSKH